MNSLIKDKKGRTILVLAVSMLMVHYSCSDVYEEHYGKNPDIAVDVSLWEQIQSNSDLEDFAGILESAGYDEVLSASQMYTVWAPKDGTFDVQSLRSTSLVNEFIQNHIGRSIHDVPDNADSLFNKQIKVLNGKVVTFRCGGNEVTFGGRKLNTHNTFARNGVLHVTEGVAPYYDNVWEYLSKDSVLTALSQYFHSMDTMIFDAESSVEGGVVNGKIYYLDSVIHNFNPILYTLGNLNDETSSYLFLAPTNKAWTEAYSRISKFYNFGKISNASELQKQYTSLALVTNTVFDLKQQLSVTDSLVSTDYSSYLYGPSVFKHPMDGLLKNAIPLQMSNGVIYKTDSLSIKPTQSWYRKIVVEAEYPYGREGQYCNTENRTSTNSSIPLSKGAYLEVTPLSTTNPTVVFSVPGTLSAVYDVYCVFVSPKMVNPSLKTALPTKARFQMVYTNANGVSTSMNLNSVTTNATKLDTVLVRKNFTFPLANYGQTTNVQLKVINNVSNKETATYTRDMLIDCVFLKPVE